MIFFFLIGSVFSSDKRHVQTQKKIFNSSVSYA